METHDVHGVHLTTTSYQQITVHIYKWADARACVCVHEMVVMRKMQRLLQWWLRRSDIAYGVATNHSGKQPCNGKQENGIVNIY